MRKALCATCGKPAEDTGMKVKGRTLFKCPEGHVTEGSKV